MSSQDSVSGCRLVFQMLGWAVLGGAVAVVFFFVSILGCGALFGGTEVVGNGRGVCVGILWWVFFYGVIPFCLLGMVLTAFFVDKLPKMGRFAFQIVGVLALFGIAAFIVFVIRS